MNESNKSLLIGRALAEERIDAGMVMDVLQDPLTGKLVVQRGDTELTAQPRQPGLIYLLMYGVDWEGYGAPVGVFAAVADAIQRAHSDQAAEWKWDRFSVFEIDASGMSCVKVHSEERSGDRFPDEVVLGERG